VVEAVRVLDHPQMLTWIDVGEAGSARRAEAANSGFCRDQISCLPAKLVDSTIQGHLRCRKRKPGELGAIDRDFFRHCSLLRSALDTPLPDVDTVSPCHAEKDRSKQRHSAKNSIVH
jgi:hypothetical protein